MNDNEVKSWEKVETKNKLKTKKNKIRDQIMCLKNAKLVITWMILLKYLKI